MLADRPLNKIWILNPAEGQSRDGRLREIERLAREKNVTIHYSERAVLDRLSAGGNHQGIIAQAAARAYADSAEVIARVRAEGREPLILILDGLQDGRNLGAILRIADAGGADLVVIPERRSVALDQYVAKASAGAIEYVPVARETNLTRFVLSLKERGFWVYGTAAEGSSRYDRCDYKGAIALVIGSEGKGISEKLKDHCDLLLTIPMQGKINSLNAAVACGIVTFAAAADRERSRSAAGEE